MVFVPSANSSSQTSTTANTNTTANNANNNQPTKASGTLSSSQRSKTASESMFRMYSDVFYTIKQSGLDENMEVLHHLMEFRKEHSDNLLSGISLTWLDKYFANIAAVQSNLNDIDIPKGKTITSYLTESNDCISFYLTGNNCLLMFEYSSDSTPKYIASAFTCHPKNANIYKCDICCMTYPELSVSVLDDNIPVLESQSFLNQLTYLTESQEMSSAKTKRKGTVVSEDREVSSPILITEWMLSLLSGGPTNIVANNIKKKVRSFVRPKQDGTRRSPFWISLKASLHYKFNKIYGPIQGKFLYKLFMLDFMSYLCQKARTYINMSNDYLMQMIIKISLRATKLENLKSTLSKEVNNQKLKDMLHASKSSAFFTTRDTKEFIQKRMDVTIQEIKKNDTFNTNFPKNTDSCSQNLNNSLQKIKDNKTLFEQREISLLNSSLPKEEHDNIYTTRQLMEYESWVRDELFTIIDESKKEKSFSDTVYKKMDAYYNLGSKFYETSFNSCCSEGYQYSYYSINY